MRHLTKRIAISIHSSAASAVTNRLHAKPQKPMSNTGRRPWRSDSAPKIGDPKKFATANVNITAPYQNACSATLVVKSPTSTGNTGMIRPIDTISISTVSMMKRMAAGRPARDGDEVLGLDLTVVSIARSGRHDTLTQNNDASDARDRDAC